MRYLLSSFSLGVFTGVQEKLGVMNKGVVYALWEYEAQSADELSFQEGDAITVLRKKDDTETEWWWSKLNDKEGYVPRNLLGVGAHTGDIVVELNFQQPFNHRFSAKYFCENRKGLLMNNKFKRILEIKIFCNNKYFSLLIN